MPVRFIVHGETASAKNSRKLVTVRDKSTGMPRTLFIKSEKARRYEADFERQARPLPALLLGPVRFSCVIYYADNRSDLDEALILDCLQGVAYKNDRQVIEKHVWKRIDRENPRAVIEIEPIQSDMIADIASGEIAKAAA